MRYRVWNPEDEGEDDAELILATSPDDAAETYLSNVINLFDDCYDLMAADEDGNQYKVSVDVEWSHGIEGREACPAFSSYSRKVPNVVR